MINDKPLNNSHFVSKQTTLSIHPPAIGVLCRHFVIKLTTVPTVSRDMMFLAAILFLSRRVVPIGWRGFDLLACWHSALDCPVNRPVQRATGATGGKKTGRKKGNRK